MEEKIESFYNYLVEKKCKDIALYDLRNDAEKTALIFVVTIANTALNKKFASSIIEQAGEDLKVEGYNKGEWIILDFGDIVLHSFIPSSREKYNLDKLWKTKKIQIKKQGKK